MRFHDGTVSCSDFGTKRGCDRLGALSAVLNGDEVVCGTGVGNTGDRRGWRGWDSGFRYSNICITIFNFISIVNYTQNRPTPSSRRGIEPKAVFSTTVHTVGKRGIFLMTFLGVVTFITIVSTCAMFPAMFSF